MIRKLTFITLLACLLTFVGDISAATATNSGKRRTLSENFHGLEWCGYCPRILAFENHLTNNYGNDVVTISYNYESSSNANMKIFKEVYDKASEYFGKIQAFPSPFIDRHSPTSPTHLLADWEPEFDYIKSKREQESPSFSVTALMQDSDKINISAVFDSEWLNGNNKVTFVAMIDQYNCILFNYYSGAKIEDGYIPELEIFAKGTQQMPYAVDNVAVASSDFNGIPLESNVKCTLTLPDLSSVIFSGYKVAAIITDQEGAVIDALAVTIPENETILKSIFINGNKYLSKIAGKPFQLTATVTPEDYDKEDLVWSSSNEKVATVDQNGNVLGLSDGTTTITLASRSNPQIFDYVEVSIWCPYIMSINFDNAEENVTIGQTYKIPFTIEGVQEWEKYDHITWVSSDENIVTVNDEGVITALALGTATITAIPALTQGIENSITVNVVPVTSKLYSADKTAYRNSLFWFPVYLKNTTDIIGLQIDINLSDGATFFTDEGNNCPISLNDQRFPSHNISYNIADNNIRIVINSNNNLIVPASDDLCMYIPVKISENAPEAIVMEVSNSVVSDINSNSVDILGFTHTFPVADVTTGDVNGDNRVDVADLTATISIILDNPAFSFIKEASDFNKDGKTDISDIVAIIDHILSPKNNIRKNVSELEESSETSENEGEISFRSDTVYTPGETTEFNVSLDNFNDIIAAQFDVELPENFSFSTADDALDIKLSEKAQLTHTLTSSKLDDRKCRIVIYSMSNKSLATESEFLTIAVNVSAEAENQENFIFGNIKLIGTDRKEYEAESVAMTVKKKETSDVTEINSTENISVDNGRIIVYTPATSPVTMFSVSGMLIDSKTPINGSCIFKADKGIYILKTKTNTYRIIMK